MSDGLYLILMLGALAILIVMLSPTMFIARCKKCGARNHLDALGCRKCGTEMPR